MTSAREYTNARAGLNGFQERGGPRSVSGGPTEEAMTRGVLGAAILAGGAGFTCRRSAGASAAAGVRAKPRMRQVSGARFRDSAQPLPLFALERDSGPGQAELG
jgi:hypothetical protein